MGVYTRGGDKGETSRLSGERTSKAGPVLEANGTIDELSAMLGFARVILDSHPLPGSRWASVGACLFELQQDLITIGAAVSSGDPESWPVPTDKTLLFETQIDEIERHTGKLTAFIIPGTSEADARLHLARCVCRRAERRLVALFPDPAAEQAVIYLNRAADLLFMLSVWYRHNQPK